MNIKMYIQWNNVMRELLSRFHSCEACGNFYMFSEYDSLCDYCYEEYLEYSA
jgi:hypothetical protein